MFVDTFSLNVAGFRGYVITAGTAHKTTVICAFYKLTKKQFSQSIEVPFKTLELNTQKIIKKSLSLKLEDYEEIFYM